MHEGGDRPLTRKVLVAGGLLPHPSLPSHPPTHLPTISSNTGTSTCSKTSATMKTPFEKAAKYITKPDAIKVVGTTISRKLQ